MQFFHSFPTYQSHHVCRRLRFGPAPSVAVLRQQEDLGTKEATDSQIPCLCLTQRSRELCVKMKACLKVQIASSLSELTSHSGTFGLPSQHSGTTTRGGRTTLCDPHTALPARQACSPFLTPDVSELGRKQQVKPQDGKGCGW